MQPGRAMRLPRHLSDKKNKHRSHPTCVRALRRSYLQHSTLNTQLLHARHT